jgi:tetratricopeptide (TPR) repeat protein
MKSIPLLLVAVVAGGVGAVVGRLAAPRPAPSFAPAGDADVGKSLRDLERSVASLEAALARLKSEVAAAPAASTRLPAGGIDEAVDRWMREHLDEWLEARAVPAAAAAETGREKAFDLAGAIAELEDPDLTDEQWEAIWKRIRDAGKTEEAMAHFERLAELDPSNPDAQVALGGAYLQKIFEVGNSPEAGVWARKADSAFDRALELDSQHWDARFSKAVSLSFWPPVFGKQREAIEHFEILARQQEGMATKPSHAQTWLYLGNLYEQLGQLDKAKEAWKKGASLFPQNADLAAKLAQGGG